MQALTLALVLTFAPLQAPAPAQTVANTPNTIRLAEGAPRPAARVADLAWLSGTWTGEGLGGAIDEVWSEVRGGTMVGYFRLVRDGKPVFYELLTLLEHEGSVEMRLKHANPDMTGWEEKNDFVTFKLARLEPDAAWFNGLTFKRISDDLIEGYIALRSGGVVNEHKLTYRRVR